MKLKKREFTQDDFENLFVVHDSEYFFLKHNGSDDSFDVEEGIEGAQLFSFEEIREVIELNADREFTYSKLRSFADNMYELHEEI